MRSAVYRYLHRFVLPVLPNSRATTHLRWRSALALVGTDFHRRNLHKNRTKLERLFDPDMPLQEELLELLPPSTARSFRVLDVGAGPASKVGKTIPSASIELVPVDPLADAYAKILAEASLTAPVPTRKGYGERLTDTFDDNSFDLAHARNSIDHCRDPLLVLKQVLRVVKPGCSFYLNHHRNEGNNAGYYGLHQWNFDIHGGEFLISGRHGHPIEVGRALEGLAVVSLAAIQDDRVVVVCRKLSTLPDGDLT